MTKKKLYYKDRHGWNGMDKWNCKLCSFDCLDEEKMKRHIEDVHKLHLKKKIEKIPVKDRFGNNMVDRYGNILYR